LRSPPDGSPRPCFPGARYHAGSADISPPTPAPVTPSRPLRPASHAHLGPPPPQRLHAPLARGSPVPPQWTLYVSPPSGWRPGWYGGAVAAVVITALAIAALLFEVLVARYGGSLGWAG
jgi:hypothetical protein